MVLIFFKNLFFKQNNSIYTKGDEVGLILQWASKMWFKFAFNENQT